MCHAQVVLTGFHATSKEGLLGNYYGVPAGGVTTFEAAFRVSRVVAWQYSHEESIVGSHTSCFCAKEASHLVGEQSRSVPSCCAAQALMCLSGWHGTGSGSQQGSVQQMPAGPRSAIAWEPSCAACSPPHLMPAWQTMITWGCTGCTGR